MKKTLKIICGICLICSVLACSSKEQVFSKSAFFFDTHINISIYHTDGETILEECMRLCEKMELIFSRTNTQSELYKINHRNSNQVTISNEMRDVIHVGLNAYKLTGGHFDITVAPLLDLWNFTSDTPTIPSQKEIQDILQNVNSSAIALTDNTLSFTNETIQIDVGALAKGYIADVLKHYLLEQGVEHGFINLGGNVLCIQNKIDNTPWNVGVQKPFANKGESIYVLECNDQSVVSSGIYERFFKVEDKLYHHLLDAKTGYPMENDIWQVTILTSSSLHADMLSSVVYLMGLEDGLKYINSLENCEALIVDSSGMLHFSNGLKE